jgi:hypothetical protein
MAKKTMTKQEMMKHLTETVSHPEFDKLVREIDAQPEYNKLEYTEEHATVKEMKKRGIPLLDGFRICVRRFEDSDVATPEFDTIDIVGAPIKPKGTWTVCASLGYFLCVSVGYSSN